VGFKGQRGTLKSWKNPRGGVMITKKIGNPKELHGGEGVTVSNGALRLKRGTYPSWRGTREENYS